MNRATKIYGYFFKFAPRLAFTLAEVLITLGIIGVVAALTIPTLMQKQQEMATVTALKKAYSTLSQAYIFAVQENGTPDNWGLQDYFSPSGSAKMLDTLAPYLKIAKNCGNANLGCVPSQRYIDLPKKNQYAMNIYSSNDFASALLSNGSIFIAFSRSGSCADATGCGEYYIDINGYKKPNQLGVDMFQFQLTKNGIFPSGGVNPIYGISFSGYCDTTLNIANGTNGEGCAAWVLYNENMDYLHCNNLSWTGLTTCN